MNIKIKMVDIHTTSLIVDGVELSRNASAFCLTQKAGELPELIVSILVVDGNLDIELPDGVVVVKQEEEKDADKC